MMENKPTQKTIVIFSGLGADERVFHQLDLKAYHVKHVKWISPLLNERIEEYAARMVKQFHCTEPPVILGLSFGGLIAIEVSKLMPYEKIILISSVKTFHEIPFYLRLAGRLRLHQLLPGFLLKRPGQMANWFFSTQNQEEKQLLNAILKDADSGFTKWAINVLLNWKNTEVPQRLKHLHGSADRLLPAKNVSKELLIKNGGHFMILNRAAEISALL